MSMSEYPISTPETRSAHLRLVFLDGRPVMPILDAETAPPSARSFGQRLVDDVLRGFALAGASVHALPPFTCRQSEQRKQVGSHEIEAARSLPLLKNWFRAPKSR